MTSSSASILTALQLEANIFARYKASGNARLFNHTTLPVTPGQIPKKIFLYWHSGENTAPEMVRLCLKSWLAQNPNWNIDIIDQERADKILPRAELPAGISQNHYADLLRITLLSQFGGVWADATVYCSRPLDDWLPILGNQSNFFAFSFPGEDRMISSWFLASKENSYIAKTLARFSLNQWIHQEGITLPYYWFHYFFEYLSRTDARFLSDWNTMVKLSADPAHLLQNLLPARDISRDNFRVLQNSPMHKLSYKHKYTAQEANELLQKIQRKF